MCHSENRTIGGRIVINYVLYETQKKSKNRFYFKSPCIANMGLNDVLGMTPTCPKQYKDKTIKDHYTDYGKYTSNFVYATTRLWYPAVKEVYVLHMKVQECD